MTELSPDIQNIQIVGLLSTFINKWFILLVPFTIWYLFKDFIRTIVIYLKIRWSNKSYTVPNGEIYLDDFWWFIKEIKFDHLVLSREEDNGNGRKYRIERKITLLNFYNSDITYRVWR